LTVDQQFWSLSNWQDFKSKQAAHKSAQLGAYFFIKMRILLYTLNQVLMGMDLSLLKYQLCTRNAQR